MISLRTTADGVVEAVAEVVVGVDARVVVVPLGSLSVEVEPAGLRNTPVVVLTDPALESTVRAGAERAGRASVASLGLTDAPTLGVALLEAAAVAEVVMVTTSAGHAGGDALVVARALAGRPLPVLPFDDEATARLMLEDCWIDLDVAIPAADGPQRELVRSVAGILGLFSAHHLVEVDPHPALDPRGRQAPSLHELTAAATGVLAGRIAAGNRRWR